MHGGLGRDVTWSVARSEAAQPQLIGVPGRTHSSSGSMSEFDVDEARSAHNYRVPPALPYDCSSALCVDEHLVHTFENTEISTVLRCSEKRCDELTSSHSITTQRGGLQISWNDSWNATSKPC